MADLSLIAFSTQPQSRRPIALFHGGPDAPVDIGARALIDAFRAADATPLRVNFERLTAAAAAAPEALEDLVSAPSLFGDRTALWLDEVRDTHRSAVTAAIDALANDISGDRRLILTTTQLRSKSALLAACRAHRACLVVACHADSWSIDDVSAAFAARSPAKLDGTARDALFTLSQHLGLGSFLDVLDRLALYAREGDAISPDDVDACAPAGADGATDDLALLLLAGRRSAVLTTAAQRRDLGDAPATQLAALGRSLGQLLAATRAAASGRRGAPLFWKLDQARKTADRRFRDFDRRLERALLEIHRCETALRSNSPIEALELDRLLLRLTRLFAPTSP